MYIYSCDTVDGSEIRQAPVDEVGYPRKSIGFEHHPTGGWSWDFTSPSTVGLRKMSLVSKGVHFPLPFFGEGNPINL